MTSRIEEVESEDIPDGWEIKRFEECVIKQRIKIQHLKNSQYEDSGRFPIIDQAQQYISGYSDDGSKVFKGELPVIIFGDHTRIFKFVAFRFVLGPDGTKILFPNKDKFNPRFLYYALLRIDIPSRGYNRHYSLLKEKSVVCPPIHEQKKIVAILSTVQEAKENTETVISALKELKKSMMKHLFTYGPVSHMEADKIQLKETEIGNIPQDWKMTTLGEIFKTMNYGTSRRCSDDTEGIPVLGIRNVVGGVVDPAGAKTIIPTDSEIEKLTLEQGDMLFVRTNATRANLGKSAVYNGEPRDAMFASYLIRVRVKTDLIQPDFIQLFSQTDQGVGQLSGRASSAADGKFNINTQTLRSLSLPLPPIQTQKTIIKIIRSVDNRIAVHQDTARAKANLFHSLLDNLLTGQVRVNNLEVPT